MTFKTYPKIKQVGHEENKDLLSNPDDEIVIQEKIDGANFRFMIKDGQIIFGSRTQELSEDKEHKFQKNFQRCIEHVRDKVTGKTSYISSSLIFYGECCVAHSMQYDWDNIPPFLGFDIYNTEMERWLNLEETRNTFTLLGLSTVPLVQICKAKDITKIDDSIVPISAYAIPSGTEDTRKAEGIVFKNYSKGIFAKYVRDKFKELNAEVFGAKSVKPNSETNVGDAIFKYCTNARIDKMIFKLIDEGEKLDMTLMAKLPKRVLEDIWEEHNKDFFESNWIIDFKEFRRKVPTRCAAVLKQVMVNSLLNVPFIDGKVVSQNEVNNLLTTKEDAK